MQRQEKRQRGSRRLRDEMDFNPLSLGRFSGALLTDLEEKQVMEVLAERDRREAVRQATIMTATVPQLHPEIRATQVFMCVPPPNFPVLVRRVTDLFFLVCVCVCGGGGGGGGANSNTNARYTVDGGPALCSSLPPDRPCPPNCNCARAMEARDACVNPWTDVEKLIYIDKFLQYPKNFHKVCTGGVLLRNNETA